MKLLRWVPIFLWVLIICWLSFSPLQELKIKPPIGADKVAHIVMYGILSFLILWSTKIKQTKFVLILFGFLMAGGTEIVQHTLITNRTGDTSTIEYTQKQLTERGIFGYKALYFRPSDKENMPYRYKEKARQNIHERGMIVMMSIGDKPWDIGNYGGIGFILPTY